MLKRLQIKNFTVFADADFEFGPGLNVLVGTNGTGKSHVLKLGYAVLYSFREGWERKQKEANGVGLPDDIEAAINLAIIRQLEGVFLIDSLKNIIRRPKASLESSLAHTEVRATLGRDADGRLEFNIVPLIPLSTLSGLGQLQPPIVHKRIENPVFIPAKEVLTLGWLLSLYNRREIAIDNTYPDLLRLLVGPPLRHPEPAHIVEQLQELIGGRVEVDDITGRFYLSSSNQPPMEMNMVAEGMRKFAVLYKLLVNGTLTSEATLFWDEPEANLNPFLLQKLAAILVELARQGFQIILATHSTDLLKEFHILSRQKDAKPLLIKYFGLNAEPGEATRIVSTDNFELLPDVVALEVELKQADNLDEIFAREDREHHANL